MKPLLIPTRSPRQNKPHRTTRPRVHALATCIALAIAAPAAWAAGEAEIVMLTGQGEQRPTDQAPWRPAAVKQLVPPGGWIRTLANSQMAIVVPTNNQLRLNQNSQMQIKAATDGAQAAVTLNAGRAWSQARPQAAAPGQRPQVSGAIRMETPSATMSVRGTDWEVEVLPDGRTQLVVLSGSVEMSNAQGAINVDKGEAAVAEVGKAPVKLTLIRPQTRVQWVSSWRPEPKRWAGDGATRWASAVDLIAAGNYSGASALLSGAARTDAAAARLLADLQVQQGELAAALETLKPHGNDPLVVALSARLMLRDDQTAQAQSLLDGALARAPRHVELLLAQGEVATLDAQVERARKAYEDVLQVQANHPEALWGLGRIASEREEVREARLRLQAALAADPGLVRARAELAATETFAGSYAAAQAALQSVLDASPDDYTALSARGVLALKRGDIDAAQEDFMRAGVIEPRYARAWLYSGVAFYQQGNTMRARQAFERAAELDPRDPLPHQFLGILQGDELDYAGALASARAARERLPFLKSLNQVANNQKGQANLGSALANFGLEEWASNYATEAYSPFWGGSHLFLADRLTGKFGKNSELFKGFLTEPTTFGASNRRSGLVPGPGHYGRVDLYAQRDNWNQLGALASVNGLSQGESPIAYFISGDFARAEARPDPSTANGRNLTLGLGSKPRHDFGWFGFVTDTQLRADLATATLPDDRMRQREQRADVGFSLQLEPSSQIWVKGGHGRQTNRVDGAFVSATTAASLQRLFSTVTISPNGRLDAFDSGIRQSDLQMRHSLRRGPWTIGWGVEHSEQKGDGSLVATFNPARTRIAGTQNLKADDVWVSLLHGTGAQSQGQVDLFAQRSKATGVETSGLDILSTPPRTFNLGATNTSESHNELNPRLGYKWQMSPAQSLRWVSQRWRRPASAATLAPVDTLGVVVNDRITSAGGLYTRHRLQWDAETSASTFWRIALDHERVDNGGVAQGATITDFEVTQLEGLLNRPEVFNAQSDLEETPLFNKGRIKSLSLAVNHLLQPRVALSANLIARDTRQEGVQAGKSVPYMPDTYVRLGARWSLAERWVLGVNTAYRSARFADDANTQKLNAGWTVGASIYHESADKRHSFQGMLERPTYSVVNMVKPETKLVLRYSIRF